jgi:DnaJ-domain-containing protein 1
LFGEKKNRIPVSIRMSDGSVVQGEITGGVTADLLSALNRDSAFVEFISCDGQRKYLAKSQFACVEALEPVQSPALSAVTRENNPYSVLGVPDGSDFDTVKEAFRHLAKKYHPDRFNALDLPEEVVRYTTEMFQQINNALKMIRGELEPQSEDDAA